MSLLDHLGEDCARKKQKLLNIKEVKLPSLNPCDQKKQNIEQG